MNKSPGISESTIQARIQIIGPEHHCILMRNNSGRLKDVKGRMVSFGLGNTSKKQNDKFKSSDLIGVTSRVITQEDVGKIMAIFTAVEVKAEGWKFSTKDKRAVAQKAFIDWVKMRGGISGFASSVQEFRELFK